MAKSKAERTTTQKRRVKIPRTENKYYSLNPERSEVDKPITHPNLEIQPREAIRRMNAGTMEQRLGIYFESDVYGPRRLTDPALPDFARLTRIEKLQLMAENQAEIKKLKKQANAERNKAEGAAKLSAQETSTTGDAKASKPETGDGNPNPAGQPS